MAKITRINPDGLSKPLANYSHVVTGEGADLSALGELWGRQVVVTGVATFRPSGSVLRIEQE